MELMLKEVLQLQVLRGARVHTGLDRLQRQVVDWVSVIEIPVEDFVRENELVLTTGVGCGQATTPLYQVVQEIIKSQAAALAIATGRHVLQVPQEVIDLAAEHEFPLIELPWETRFAEITQSVLYQLMERRHFSPERGGRVQRGLLQLLLREADLSDIAEAVRQRLGLPVVIVDRQGQVQGKSHRSEMLIRDWLDQPEPRIDPNPAIPSDEQPANRPWHRIKLPGHVLLQTPIRSGGDIQGHLLIPGDPQATDPAGDQPTDATSITAASPLTHDQAQILEDAVLAAALWFLREKAVKSTETRMRGDFVFSLAKGEIESWDMVLSRAKSLNYNVGLPYVCIMGVAENPCSTPAEGDPNPVIGLNPKVLEEQVEATAGSLRKAVMTTYRDDELLIFMEAPADDEELIANKFLDALETQLQNLFFDMSFSWGIGARPTGDDPFQHGYQTARIALDIGRRQKGPGMRTSYASTGIYRALLRLSDDPELRSIATSTAGVLAEYSQQRGMDLIDTLSAYIHHHGNASQAAQHLNLHRQSLLYRLRKIEALTGRSLTNADDRFLLELGVKLWTMSAP